MQRTQTKIATKRKALSLAGLVLLLLIMVTFMTTTPGAIQQQPTEPGTLQQEFQEFINNPVNSVLMLVIQHAM